GGSPYPMAEATPTPMLEPLPSLPPDVESLPMGEEPTTAPDLTPFAPGREGQAEPEPTGGNALPPVEPPVVPPAPATPPRTQPPRTLPPVRSAPPPPAAAPSTAPPEEPAEPSEPEPTAEPTATPPLLDGSHASARRITSLSRFP